MKSIWYIKHSAKGTTWEDHKYIKRIDGTYYYPDSYKGGRHLPDGEGSRAEYGEYKEGDSDFDDDKYKDENRFGDTDFFVNKRSDGRYVLVEEDMKWVLPKGVKPTAALKKKLEALSNTEHKSADDFVNAVNDAIATTTGSKKSDKNSEETSNTSSENLSDQDIENLAKEVIRGNFGNGKVRKDLLQEHYAEIQSKVNELMKSSGKKSSGKTSDKKKEETPKEETKTEKKHVETDREIIQKKQEELKKKKRNSISHSSLSHYGIARKSGRYPWGSGDRPYQGDGIAPSKKVKKPINPNQLNTSLNNASNLSRHGSNVVKQTAERKKMRENANVDLSKMTDQELQKAVNRMTLERNYNSLTSDKKIRGHLYVSNILDTAGDVTAGLASAVAIAVAIKSLRS